MTDLRGLHLRCAHGSYGWGALDLHQTETGFALLVHCELGDHYLQPDPRDAQRLTIGTQPFAWPTERDASEAHARYLAQEETQR
jgi:hypothetical protein